jgi:hypothetical protein
MNEKRHRASLLSCELAMAQQRKWRSVCIACGPCSVCRSQDLASAIVVVTAVAKAEHHSHCSPSRRPAMNANEYLNQLPPRSDRKLAQYKEEIRILFFGKASADAIRTFLRDSHGLIVSRQAIWQFCKRHFSMDTDAASIGDGQSSASRLKPPVTIMSTPSQSGPSSPAPAAREMPRLPRYSVEPGAPAQASREQTPAQPRVESPNADREGPTSNAEPEMPAFQPTAPTPASRIDAVETESLIPPGFFGPASGLNPPYDTHSKEHRAMLDAQEKDMPGDGSMQSRRPAWG